MMKVNLLLCAIGVIWAWCTAAVVRSSPENPTVEGCKSETELWGSVDGTKFYFCIGNNSAIEEKCQPNTFFVKNGTVTGCIPVDEVEDNCVYRTKLEPCKGINMLQPQPHPDPTKFYLCTKEGAAPVELACVNNKAFAKQDGWMGCFDWVLWRSIRGCNATE